MHALIHSFKVLIVYSFSFSFIYSFIISSNHFHEFLVSIDPFLSYICIFSFIDKHTTICIQLHELTYACIHRISFISLLGCSSVCFFSKQTCMYVLQCSILENTANQ